MSKKIIKNIFQTILILIIFSFGFIKLERAVYPFSYARYLESKEHLLENQKFSVLIVGNSHAVYSYAPNILDSISVEENFLNLSSNGAGIPSSYFYIKNAIKMGQTPDLVVLEIYTLRYNDYDESLPMLMEYNLADSMIDILRYLPANEHNLSFSDFFGNFNWKNTFKYIEDNIKIKEKIIDIENFDRTQSKGYLTTDEIVTVEAYQKSYQAGAFPIDMEYHQKIIHAIIDLCKDNGIDVILLRSPAINTLGLEDPFAQKIADKYEISYIDLNVEILNEIDNPRYLFYDALVNNVGMVNSHTNNNGAIYSSLKLAEYLQELGYIEIDQEVYDTYWNDLQNTLASYEIP